MAVLTLFFAVTVVYRVTLCTCAEDNNWIRDTLTSHFSKPRHHETYPQYKNNSKMFIRNQFNDIGLEIIEDEFPTLLNNVYGVNVIGVLKGQHYGTPKDTIVAIGAHYDTVWCSPGVNDNGAAVVVMLKAARELSKQPDRISTVLFVAFDFEEGKVPGDSQVACNKTGCGSRHFVKKTLPTICQGCSWNTIFVMDTIMNFNQTPESQMLPGWFQKEFNETAKQIEGDESRGNFLMIAGRADKDDAHLQKFQNAWVHDQFKLVPLYVPVDDMHIRDRSDHAAFWTDNLSAIFLTDTAEARGYMRQCYHKECDNMNRVTDTMLTFAEKTCSTLVDLINQMAPVINPTFQSGEHIDL